MKKLILLSVIFVGLSASAQLSFNNDTIDLIINEGEQILNEGRVEIINSQTSGNLSYDYTIFTDEFKSTTGWTVQFCDCEQCLENYPLTGSCKDLAPGEKWFFIVDAITKKSFDGKFFSIAFSNPNDTKDRDTVTFKTKTGNLLGIENQIANSVNLNIVPNPSSSKTNIAFDAISGSAYTLSIINLLGESVEQFEINGNNQVSTTSLDVTALQSGIYFVVLSDGINSEVQKLVVN